MFKRVRSTYWFAASFIKKHFIIILISLPLGFFGYVSFTQLKSYLPPPKPYLSLGRIGRFTLTNLPPDIKNQLSSGLTSLTPQGEATASLALSWDVTTDGKTYLFHLNPARTWSDGQPITARDLDYSIADVTISYPPDASIQFDLKEAYAPFPTIVSQPVFRRPLKSKLPFFWRRPQLVGTGPYRLIKAVSHGSYLRQLLIESNQQKIRYVFYPTETAAILGFKLGEVDQLVDITDPKDLSLWPNATITPLTHFDRYLAVLFNTQDANLADKNLRQALTYAIPQKPQDQTRALSSFNPNSWAYNSQVKPYFTNPDTARELVKKSQEETQSNTLPQLELLTSIAYLPIAEAIKTSWDSLGIITTVRVITHPPETFQSLLVAHQIPPDPDQYTLWHSSQATNLTRYSSPKLDKLLEDGRQTLDQEQRQAIYQDFQRFLVEDTPAAFLFYPTTSTISRK